MKIFIPCDTFKDKDAIGYWKDENGKLYVDYIQIVDIDKKDIIPQCKKLFAIGEKAVFIQIDENFSYIINDDFSTVLLKNKIVFRPYFMEAEKKSLLLKYNGFTRLNNGKILVSKKV